MPDTGATFNLLNNAVYPAINGTVIEADPHNALMEDVAQGLTDRVTRNGSGSMSGNLNMGTHKATNLAEGTSNGDSVRYEQVQLVNAFATAWEGASWAAGKMGYATSSSAVALVDTTAAGRSILNFTDPNADKLAYFRDSDATWQPVTLSAQFSFSGGTLGLDADLATLAGLTVAADNFIAGNAGGTAWEVKTPAGARTSLGLSALATTTPGTGVATFLTTPSFANLSSAVTGTWNLPSGSQLNGTAFGTASVKNTGTSGNTVPLLDGAATTTGLWTFTGQRTKFQANSELFAIALAYGSGTGVAYIGATNSATPAIQVSNNAGSSIATFKNDRTTSFDGAIDVSGNTVVTVAGATMTGELILANAGATNSLTAGFRGLGNTNGQNGDYTLTLNDAGKNVGHNPGSGTHTYTVVPSATTAWPDGSVHSLWNLSGTLQVTGGTGVTFYYMDGNGTAVTTEVAGTFTVPIGGRCALQFIGNNSWLVSGHFTI